MCNITQPNQKNRSIKAKKKILLLCYFQLNFDNKNIETNKTKQENKDFFFANKNLLQHTEKSSKWKTHDALILTLSYNNHILECQGKE